MAVTFIDATPSFNGRTFQFRLTREVLDVGLPEPVIYYGMHGGQFRNRGGGVNFRPAIDSWWAAMHEGASPNQHDYMNRVWAEAYGLVSTARSMQDVYRDAYLSKQIDRNRSLPDGEMQRLRSLVRGPLCQVQAELEQLFLGELPSASNRALHTRRASEWIDDGMVALRNQGEPGLREWVTNIEHQIARMRKRGGADLDREFLNMFSYESKASFHVCYANAWVKLIPWLRDNHGLDHFSERFMWLMHRLNREGNMPGLSDGQRRGTLAGQVLSLHPISRCLIAQSNHRKAIGLLIGQSDYDAISNDSQRMATCPQYLDVLATILCAAREYIQAGELYERRRGVFTTSGSESIKDRASVLDNHARDDALPDIASELETYAIENRITCPICSGPAKYVSFEREGLRSDRVAVRFDCAKGHPSFQRDISLEQYSQWIRADDAANLTS